MFLLQGAKIEKSCGNPSDRHKQIATGRTSDVDHQSIKKEDGKPPSSLIIIK
jgi:hypothetical protein